MKSDPSVSSLRSSLISVFIAGEDKLPSFCSTADKTGEEFVCWVVTCCFNSARLQYRFRQNIQLTLSVVVESGVGERGSLLFSAVTGSILVIF